MIKITRPVARYSINLVMMYFFKYNIDHQSSNVYFTNTKNKS